jgi:hypothetical protein
VGDFVGIPKLKLKSMPRFILIVFSESSREGLSKCCVLIYLFCIFTRHIFGTVGAVVIFFVVVIQFKRNSKQVLAKSIKGSLPSRIQRLTRRVNEIVSDYN